MNYLKVVLITATALVILGLTSNGLGQTVVINEVMYDDYSTDDSTYVELYGTPGMSLDGYQLVGVNGYNGSEYNTIILTGNIPGDGFYVVGQSTNVTNVDLVDENVNYQNSPDNILLKQGSSIVDAIGYGEFQEPHIYFVGEGEPAPDQSPGNSLSRIPDGEDTDDNLEDFHLTNLTPGAPNGQESEPPFYTLYYIRQHQLELMGQWVWTTGIANVNSDVFNGSLNISAYMQDEQAGINIYGGQWTFMAGDCLWVKATVGEWSGLLELTGALVINVGSNVGVPDPFLIDCQIANNNGELLEGMLVGLEDVWITSESELWPDPGNNANMEIIDSSGITLVMRIDKDTELDEWDEHPEVGELFNLTAIANQYLEDYQVLPRHESDFYFPPPEEPIISLSTNVLDFDDVPIGEQAELSLIIYNEGTANLILYNVYSTNLCFNTDFREADSLITPTDSLIIAVTFTPTETILYEEELSIQNNDEEAIVNLVGRGMESTSIGSYTHLPQDYPLVGACPNPFNPFTVITFTLLKSQLVSVKVYDVTGNFVAELFAGWKTAGVHKAVFNGSNLPSGIYIYRLTVNSHQFTGKLVLMK